MAQNGGLRAPERQTTLEHTAHLNLLVFNRVLNPTPLRFISSPLAILKMKDIDFDLVFDCCADIFPEKHQVKRRFRRLETSDQNQALGLVKTCYFTGNEILDFIDAFAFLTFLLLFCEVDTLHGVAFREGGLVCLGELGTVHAKRPIFVVNCAYRS